MSIFEGAEYIKAQKEPSGFSFYDPAPLFRREFVAKDPQKARIYVQSPGFAKYYINGQDITEDLFISAVSDYNKILWYNEYDVTHLISEGKNVVSVIAGNGFFNESFKSLWDFYKAEWRDAPQFCLRLEINGETALVSDESWKCNRENSHIIYNHLRSGEYHDMRKKDRNWMTVGYDDSSWSNAVVREKPVKAELLPTTCQPIREVEKIDVKTISKADGGYLLDFGVNMSGYVEARLCCRRDSEILFHYAEEVDERGCPAHNGMNVEHFYPEAPFQLNKMIASGDEDVFKPLFSYHGFRYVFVEGLDEMPKPSQFSAYFVHQDIACHSDFSCGNDVINYVYNAGIRSTYSNLFWCLTDCPTREKLGWMNDAQSSVEQTLINFDIIPLYEKWYEDIKASIFPDGSLHGTIPAPDWRWGHSCGPVCDCMLYELPYKVYLYTGQKEMLVSAVEVMEQYAEFLEQKCMEGHDFSLGDWLGCGTSKLTPKEFVRDFYLIKALRVTVLANELAKKDARRWQEKLEKYTQGFAKRYEDASGRCTVNEQCAISMMIAGELCRDKKTMCEQLVSVVQRDELKLTCGMVGTQYLYDALSESGRADLAMKMICESDPGYKSWFDSGATTLWERWDGKHKDSHNHHMFSGIIAWFFKSLLGIAPNAQHPAFEEIELKPEFISELGFASGSFKTVRGVISASWKGSDNEFQYRVSIPEGVKAKFRGIPLHAGENSFFVKDGVCFEK